MSEQIDLDAIRDRREACLRSDGTTALNCNCNFVHYDGRALIAEVERSRSQVRRLKHLLRMFHAPCRYPAVECTVCEALDP